MTSSGIEPWATPHPLAIEDHRISGVRFIESPNRDRRPADTLPRLIVIHSISLPPQEYGGEGISSLFTNQLDPSAHPYYAGIAHLKVSAHLLIRRTGEIIQYVPFDQRAWHAGLSSYLGQTVCNDFSIGIEVEGSDLEPFENPQYQALNACLQALIKHYTSLSWSQIAGHEEIAPARKTDPGPFFVWEKLQNP